MIDRSALLKLRNLSGKIRLKRGRHANSQMLSESYTIRGGGSTWKPQAGFHLSEAAFLKAYSRRPRAR